MCTQSRWQRRRGQQEEVDGAAPACGQDFIFWDEGRALIINLVHQSLARNTPSSSQGQQSA